MMDAIYEMVGYVRYFSTLGDTFERYNTNTVLKKILLFPILFICILLLVVITPFMMVGSLVRLVFVFIDWVNDALDDQTIFRYGLDSTVFLYFFLTIFALYGIMWFLYLLHKLLNYVLGKTITERCEEDIDYNISNSSFMDSSKETKRETKENIYIINSEDYK